MAIYLGSAKLDEAWRAKDPGWWVSGVTTNPTLMAKTGGTPEDVLEGPAILEFHQVYYQLISQDLDDMLAEAHKAVEIVKRGLVLKIAPTEKGFRFVAQHGTFLCTLVFANKSAI